MNGAERDPVEAIAEDFLARFRAGENPRIDEYADRYPHLSHKIAEIFPTLLVIEQCCPVDASDDAAPTHSEIPTQLGEYRILGKIGQGGMGVVYEAIHESLGRRVALKLLPLQSLMNPVQLERFHQEARAAAKLHHSNIVPVFDIGEHQGMNYYAMQFIEGQSLAEVIVDRQCIMADSSPDSRAFGPVHAPERANPSASTAAMLRDGDTDRAGLLSSGAISARFGTEFFRDVARIGRQVALALDFAHDQGILHRDIKPSNLLLDHQGRPWVTDFGLAKTEEAEDLTFTGGVVGTLRYMAPERFQGVSRRESDIYGLGCTLYELVTLQPMFSETDRAHLVQSINEKEPIAPRVVQSLIPRDLETIILKSINKDPDRRYQSAEDMAEDLDRWLHFKPIKARPVTRLERISRWCQRRPLVASLLAMLTIITITGFGLVAWKWQEAEQNLQLASAAREDESRQFARAEQNLKQAQDLVHDYFIEVSESSELLAGTPGTQKLRSTLLAKAEDYYREFLRENQNSANEFALIEARSRLGEIQLELGKLTAAHDSFLKSLSALESLDEQSSDVSVVSAVHAKLHLHLNLARITRQISGPSVALDHTRVAIASARLLLKNSPESREFNNDLAASYNSQGVLLLGLEDFVKANDCFQNAISIRESLQPDSIQVQDLLGLAFTYHQLGDLNRDQDLLDDSVDYYSKSLAVSDQISLINPTLRKNQHSIALDHVAIAVVFDRQSDWNKAVEHGEHAIEIFTRLVQSNPAVPRYLRGLSRAHYNLYVSLIRMNRSRDATDQLELSVAVTERHVELTHEQALHGDTSGIADLVGKLIELGRRVQKQGNRESAIVHFERALTHQEQLVRKEEFIPEEQTVLAGIHWRLAKAYSAQRKLSIATEQYEKTLFIRKRLCENNPASFVRRNELGESHNNLGAIYNGQGDHALAIEQFTQAKNAFQFAASQDTRAGYHKNLARATGNLADALQASGKLQDSIGHYEESLRLRQQLALQHPQDSESQRLLVYGFMTTGQSYMQIGKLTEAEEFHKNAITLLEKLSADHPTSKDDLVNLLGSRVNLGAVHLAREEFDQAINVFEPALKKLQEIAHALAAYYAQNTLKLLVSALSQRAWRLATDMEQENRNAAQAISDATRACEMTQWAAWTPMDCLAAAYAENKQFEEAVMMIERASGAAPASVQKKLTSRRALYESERPYRNPRPSPNER